MTVVDLRSNEGEDRMVQEFAGAIEDGELLTRLVIRRLGPRTAKWTPINRHIFSRKRH